MVRGTGTACLIAGRERRKMLRIGICDNEVQARDDLRIQLEKVLTEGKEEIVYEFSSGTGAVRWLRAHPGEIDLLFLDVEMEGMNGVEAAEALRTFDRTILIVFMTGYSDYVFDGYRVNALDYMMKPTEERQLARCMERVREQMTGRRDKMFVFKNTDGMFRMAKEDISYFYSNKRKVYLVNGEKEYPFYGRLDEVEEQVAGSFVRIHQRYLVNPDQVEHIGSAHVTVAGKILPVSRSLKEEATVKLAKAMLGADFGGKS